MCDRSPTPYVPGEPNREQAAQARLVHMALSEAGYPNARIEFDPDGDPCVVTSVTDRLGGTTVLVPGGMASKALRLAGLLSSEGPSDV